MIRSGCHEDRPQMNREQMKVVRPLAAKAPLDRVPSPRLAGDASG